MNPFEKNLLLIAAKNIRSKIIKFLLENYEIECFEYLRQKSNSEQVKLFKYIGGCLSQQ